MTWPKGRVGEVLVNRLKPGESVIDVGASNGCVSTACAKVVGPTGHVYAFEPDPRWWAELGRAARAHAPTLQPFAVVVTNGNGPVTYHQSRHQAQSAVCAGNPGLEEPTTLQAMAITLDDWFADEAIAAVKLDVQGHEGKVLDGAKALLKSVPCWVWECWPAALKAEGESALSVCERFVAYGYMVTDMQGRPLDDFRRLDHELSGMSHCNLIAEKG